MTELNFNEDRAFNIDYTIKRLGEMESGCPEAIRYIEWLWDTNPELLEDAREAFYNEQEEL